MVNGKCRKLARSFLFELPRPEERTGVLIQHSPSFAIQHSPFNIHKSSLPVAQNSRSPSFALHPSPFALSGHSPHPPITATCPVRRTINGHAAVDAPPSGHSRRPGWLHHRGGLALQQRHASDGEIHTLH